MYIRKITAAAGFACGAALAFAPISTADTASFWPGIDGILAGLPAADTMPTLDLAISFDGINLLSSGDATATTVAGQYGFALAYGDHATAYAAGGLGNSASAIGNYALAEAGSKAATTGFNFNSATDIGNNADPSTYVGAPDGAYAGGGSLIGNTDAAIASSNNTAQFIGSGGTDTEALNGGNSGAFAGDSGLIGYNHVAGSGNTAYTSGDIKGFGDGSAAVGGTGNSAFTNGTETGSNEGAFSGFGNYNSATADTNYTLDNHGVSATFGDYNYASVYGPNNSTADVGGDATHLGNGNIGIVSDPFGTAADSANAGSSATTSGNSDLAEVLLTHGNASATGGNNLYDILSSFGNFHSASLPAAADAASVVPITSTVSSEIASLNSIFEGDAALASVPATDIIHTAGSFDTISPDNLTNTFSSLVFGLNPENISTDPGAYDVFNGALTEFYDAYNVGLYALLNGGDLLGAGDVFGAPDTIADVLGGGATATTALSDFLQLGFSDLLGYFDPTALLSF
jgi:hypothetical protein